jgi:hypothetical protein
MTLPHDFSQRNMTREQIECLSELIRLNGQPKFSTVRSRQKSHKKERVGYMNATGKRNERLPRSLSPLNTWLDPVDLRNIHIILVIQ